MMKRNNFIVLITIIAVVVLAFILIKSDNESSLMVTEKGFDCESGSVFFDIKNNRNKAYNNVEVILTLSNNLTGKLEHYNAVYEIAANSVKSLTMQIPLVDCPNLSYTLKIANIK